MCYVMYICYTTYVIRDMLCYITCYVIQQMLGDICYVILYNICYVI